MKKQGVRMLSAIIACIMMAGISTSWAASPKDVPRISVEKLKELMEDSAAELVILDVRTGSSWSESDTTIETAIREEPKDFESWAEKYPQEKIIVLYCT